MIHRTAIRRWVALGLCLFAPSIARASNGTEFTGYGVKAQGMGGAAVALPQDAIAAANNPAGMAFVGDRFDGGVQAIYVHAKTDIGPNRFTGTSIIPVPEFGYNRELSPKLTVGVSSSPSGALFRYGDNITPGATSGHTKGMLINSAILPTATYRPTPNLAIGVSAAVALQVLWLHDLPGSANHGIRPSVGAGYRVGALWRANDVIAIGASYASKIDMGRTQGYHEDVLASVGGHVDVPEKISAGVALTPTRRLAIAADYVHVNWSDTQFHTLFGFRDQDVARIGASYELTPTWTVRSGLSIARRAPSRDFVLPNVLIVSIDSKAATAGVTHRLKNGAEISAATEVNFGGAFRGTGPSAGTTMRSTYLEIGLAYGIPF